MNVVAPDKTKELTGSGGNGSLIVSDHYSNHLGMIEFKYRFKEKINFYKAVA